jgi:threonine aldolase
MRAVMAAAEVGDEQEGWDPTTNELQDYGAELLGKEASLFVPSATMANQIAFKVHTRPGDEIIMHKDSHPIHFEGGAIALLSGASVCPLDGPRGMFEPEQVAAAIRPDDPHHPHTRLLSVENTHNLGGGSVWPVPKLHAVAAIARKHGLSTHLDGARLMNAAVASGVPASVICEPFDSVTLCLSKGLGAPIGALVAGSKEFIYWSRRAKKVFGGAMRQTGLVTSGALYALRHNVDRLAEDHANAKMLAEALSKLPGIAVDPDVVDTNLVYFDVAGLGVDSIRFCTAMLKEGVRMLPERGSTVRAATHLDLSTEDIRQAIEIAARVVGHPKNGIL